MLKLRRPLMLLAALAMLALAAEVPAQELKTYGVLPFKINGPDKYQYLSMGVQSMLKSRLAWTGHFEPAPKSQVDRAAGEYPQDATEALRTKSAVGADILVWGLVNIIGDQAALDVQVLNADNKPLNITKEMAVSELIPALENTAKEIRSKVFKRPGEEKQQAKPASSQAPKNDAFLYVDEGTPGGVNSLNPQFRYQGGTENPGRWRSQTLPFSSRNMVVGDVNADGKNEVVFMNESALLLYKLQDNRLVKLDEYGLSAKDEPLRIHLIDLNRDGADELTVSLYRDGRPYAMIMSLMGNTFKIKYDGIRRYLSVIRMPPSYQKVLVGQRQTRATILSSRNVTEMYPASGEIVDGRRISVPEFTNPFNFCYLPGEQSYKVVQVTDTNKLKTYSDQNDPLAASSESYNSSPIKMPLGTGEVGSKPGDDNNFIESYYYVPIRLSPHDFEGDGTWELITSKDITMAGQVFDRFKSFTQGELHAMYWDGVGLNLAWKTRRIKGAVLDYAIADLSGDGKLQLCVLVNTFPGAVSFRERKTLVLAYDLNVNAIQ